MRVPEGFQSLSPVSEFFKWDTDAPRNPARIIAANVSKNYKKTMNRHSKMTKTTFNLLITGLIIFWFPLTLKAQLFETNELYPNIKMIKGKYYNGTGGGGYWSLDRNNFV